MRFVGLSALVLALTTTGCLSSCVEVVSQEDLEPLPPEPIGPRGMPAFASLTAEGHAGHVSMCAPDDPGEHDHSAYDTTEMKRGSAKRLRGRVAVLDLRVASAHAEPWSRIALRHADDEAADARAFVLREAERYGVTDLSLDVIPWFVTTELPEVQMHVDGRGRPDWGEGRALKASAFAHVAKASGVSVPNVVAALKKSGYQEVAVMLRIPTTHVVREFALWGESDGVDVAIVQQTPRQIESGTYAHELIHLFGADDLYRLTKRDPADDDDVMGGRCGSLQDTRIGETTAWAIGWQGAPERSYATGPRPKRPVAQRR